MNIFKLFKKQGKIIQPEHVDVYWHMRHRILKTEQNASKIPVWYTCPKCHRQFQTSPPTIDFDGMRYDTCPDCERGLSPKESTSQDTHTPKSVLDKITHTKDAYEEPLFGDYLVYDTEL